MTTIFDPSLSNTPRERKVSTPGTAPFAKDLLEKGQALTSAPMPAYTGKLTTGPSDLQHKAWQGIANLTVPTNITAAGNEMGNIADQFKGKTYTPGQITGSDFDTAAAQKYMNPYIEAALNPQLEALRKAAKLAENDQLGKLAVSGALGGTKEAQLQALNRENLFKQQQGILGTGYASAYDKAASQFNTDQSRNIDVQKENEKNAQFAAKYGMDALDAALKAQQARAQVGGQEAQYGLANLQALATAGGTKQGLEQAAANADYNEYLRQLKYPQEMLKLQRDLISGAGLGSEESTYGQKASTMDSITGAFKAGVSINDMVKQLTGSGIPFDKAFNYVKSAFGSAKDSFTPEQIRNAESDLSRIESGYGGNPVSNDQMMEDLRKGFGISDVYVPGVDYVSGYDPSVD